MDAIIYLTLDKGNHTGGPEAGPPVFTIRVRDSAYRLLWVKLPAGIFQEETGKRTGKCTEERIRKRTDKYTEKYTEKCTGKCAEKRKGRRAGKREQAEGKVTLSGRLALRRAEQLARMEEARMARVVEGLFETLSPYLAGCSARYTVYGEEMEQKRLPEGSGGLWHQLWRLPELTDFREEAFARELLSQCRLPHYLVVGWHDTVPELLWERARHMKSLRFLVEKPVDELEDFAEAVDEEYGLAVTVQELPETDGDGRSAFKKARPVCPVPAVVLDFSGDARLLTDQVARGSVWLDMDASEEKRRRIEGRDTGLLYFSMKKLWKQAGMLDTMGKNRYNT